MTTIVLPETQPEVRPSDDIDWDSVEIVDALPESVQLGPIPVPLREVAAELASLPGFALAQARRLVRRG